MTIDLTADARTRLDAHLDAVEQALITSGRSREQRRGIVDDLEAQIRDMLASKSAKPTSVDLDAVLASLDPPAAYRPSNMPHPHPIYEIAAITPSTAPATVSSSFVTPAISPAMGISKSPAKRSLFMKSSVLVALIVCGTLLLMTPAIADHFRAAQNQQTNLQFLSVLATHTDLANVIIPESERMGDLMRIGLWLSGSLAIVASIAGGFVAFEREGRR